MRDLMFKFFVLIANLVLILVINAFVMIYGWGIQPQSWSIIIGGYAAIMAANSLAALVKP